MRHNLSKHRWIAHVSSVSLWCAQRERLGEAITQRAHTFVGKLCQPPVQYRIALLLAALLAVACTVFLVLSQRTSSSPVALRGLMEQLL